MVVRQIVQHALMSGQLTAETEFHLGQLFDLGTDLEDIEALTDLQQAVMMGQVKRQSMQMDSKTFSSDR
ncbi:MAG: hypothetical protein KME16_15500 [Scytolyngbya sp. HA4215-MV1]|jgi:hypothetical protein|nr:hypothetical protein [Scytolyngbya sp. HA4215-MV1]